MTSAKLVGPQSVTFVSAYLRVDGREGWRDGGMEGRFLRIEFLAFARNWEEGGVRVGVQDALHPRNLQLPTLRAQRSAQRPAIKIKGSRFGVQGLRFRVRVQGSGRSSTWRPGCTLGFSGVELSAKQCETWPREQAVSTPHRSLSSLARSHSQSICWSSVHGRTRTRHSAQDASRVTERAGPGRWGASLRSRSSETSCRCCTPPGSLRRR